MSTENNDDELSLDDISELEKELIKEPEKKSTMQILRIVLAISMFFGAFNLTILFNNLL